MMSDLVRRPGRRLVMPKQIMLDLFSADGAHPDDKMIYIVSILRPGHGHLWNRLDRRQIYRADEAGYHWFLTIILF